jgi:hypothetical protein
MGAVGLTTTIAARLEGFLTDKAMGRQVDFLKTIILNKDTASRATLSKAIPSRAILSKTTLSKDILRKETHKISLPKAHLRITLRKASKPLQRHLAPPAGLQGLGSRA